MASKLKNIKLTSVDLVHSGANPEADICLFKSGKASEEILENDTGRYDIIYEI